MDQIAAAAISQVSRLTTALWIYDFDNFRIAWANPAAVEVWNAASLEELCARDLTEGMSPGVKARLRQYQIDLSDPSREFRESWTLYPKGTPTSLNVVFRGITLPDGRLAMFCEGVAADTEKKMDYRRSVDALLHAPVMITLFAADGRALYHNPASRSSKDDIDLPLRERFVDPDAAERFLAALDADQQTRVIEQVHTAQGIRWHEVNARQCLDAATGVEAILVTELDVTDMKEAEKRAEAADRTKSQFLANMSHEIRTPLNGVLGMAELLGQTQLQRRQRDMVSTITQSGVALLSVLNDILDFSKLEAGRMTLSGGEVNLRELAEDVATLMSAQVENSDVELIIRVAPDVPHLVNGDVGRLRQILLNIVGNAVKFTEQGNVIIRLSGTEESTEDHFVLRCEVEDTGAGIPSDKLKQVFDKFSQIDNSVTRQHEGSGLGLSICSSLIELMAGTIGVESTLGEGSCFWFEIKFPVIAAKPEADAELSIEGKRVLLAEANPQTRAALCALLSEAGCEVTAVADGPSTSAHLSAEDPALAFDCAVFDQGLFAEIEPDVADTLRKSTLRTVLMTKSLLRHNDDRAALFDVHIAKPVRAEALRRAIREDVTELFIPADNPAAASSGSATSNPGRQGLDLLICEDNAVNQKLIREVMTLTSFSYALVSSGREALKVYEAEAPRLILMDISMPGMSGDEVIRELRRREIGIRHTPVIAFSAHVMHEDIQRFKDAGADDFLAKPVSPLEMVNKISGWIEHLDRPDALTA